MEDTQTEEVSLLELEKALLALGERGLDENIENLLQRVDEIRMLFNDDTDTIKYIDSIKAKLLSGNIDSNYISDLHFSIHFTNASKPKERIKNSSELSLIYTSIAIISNHHKKSDSCWFAIAKANHYLGMTLGLYNQLEKRARNGGLKKAEPARITKSTFIELLDEFRPAGGWRTPLKTIDDLTDKLLQSLTKKNITTPLEKNELTSTLLNMIMEDKDVKKAYSNSNK